MANQLTLQTQNDKYFCRLKLHMNGEGIKLSHQNRDLDETFFDDVKVNFLSKGHITASESDFDCSRRNLDDDFLPLPVDEAIFIFKLTVTNRKAFVGNIN